MTQMINGEYVDTSAFSNKPPVKTTKRPGSPRRKNSPLKVLAIIAAIIFGMYGYAVIADGIEQRHSTASTSTSTSPSNSDLYAGDTGGYDVNPGADTYTPSRDYSTQAPGATAVPDAYNTYGGGYSTQANPAEIAAVATERGILLHKYELGFSEQNQRFIKNYPVYDTKEYPDHKWYTWSRPTVGMTILMRNVDTQEAKTCTLGGFVRSRDTGEVFGLTAGHCASGGYSEVAWKPSTSPETYDFGYVIAWQTSGMPASNDVFPFDTDTALIRLAPGIAESINFQVANTYKTTGIYDQPQLAPGMKVCMSGYRSGETCGSIVAVNDSIVRVHLFTQSGDSGGMLYARNGDGTINAIGVLSSAPTLNGQVHDFLADFALINPVLNNMGLRLVA